MTTNVTDCVVVSQYNKNTSVFSWCQESFELLYDLLIFEDIMNSDL